MLEPFLADPDVTLYQGDALEVLRQLPAESVDMCCTSPPFYGLRSYIADGHEDKPLEIGLEDSPNEWVARLVDVFREVRRVLKPWGTCWIECGDSYAQYDGQGNKDDPREPGMHGSFRMSSRLRDTAESRGDRRSLPSGFKRKDLLGQPWMLVFALRADGWWLRQAIIWSRSNPMPESVTDRCTTSHSYIFLLAKQARYYWDPEPLREPAAWDRWGDQTVLKPQPGTASWIKPKSRGELPDPSRGANGAAASGSTLRPEVSATFRTADGTSDARGWHDLGESQIAVDPAVTADARCFQVLEPVGLKVGIEAAEGNFVMHLESTNGSAVDASVSVAIQSSLPLLPPVWSSVADIATAPSGALLASESPDVPLVAALARAKCVAFELARISEDYGAATLAFESEELSATLLVWGTLSSAHTVECTGISSRNCRSVWTFPTQPFPGSHFAVFPEELVRRCLLAGTSERGVCPVCGRPWEREIEREFEKTRGDAGTNLREDESGYDKGAKMDHPLGYGRYNVTTLGWRPSCDHAKGKHPASSEPFEPLDPISAVVLDPFAGAGTTAVAARKHGRRSILIELNRSYCDLIADRLAQQSLLAQAGAAQ